MNLKACWNPSDSSSTHTSLFQSTLASSTYQTRSQFTCFSRDTVSKSGWSESLDSPLYKLENPFLLVGLKPIKEHQKNDKTQKNKMKNRIDEILFERIHEQVWRDEVSRKVKEQFDYEAEVDRLLELD